MKRRWFQIHLSTAIALMFVAGGLAWANLPQRNLIPQYPMSKSEVFHYFRQGFPFVFNMPREISDDGHITYEELQIAPLIADLIAALAILATFAVVCEFIIRRREARKP